MNHITLQRSIIAGSVAVALLLAFMLGEHMGTRSAARKTQLAVITDDAPPPQPRSPPSSPPREVPPPVALTPMPSPTVDPLTLDVHWSDATNGLDRARRELNSATMPNHGGWVEKARADLQRTLGDFNVAAGYLNDHPEFKGTPAAMSDVSEIAVARVKEQQLSRNANQSHLVNALEGLQSALDALAQTGGGTLDGHRDTLIADIDATATDVVGAFNYLASGRTAPRADAVSPDRGHDLP